LLKRKLTLTVGYPFAGIALRVLEPYAVKVARTVLRGRKLPGPTIARLKMKNKKTSDILSVEH